MSLRQPTKDGNGDEYYTPKYVVEILLPYLKNKGIKTIWCPCDKDWSWFVKVFQDNGFNVLYSHIEEFVIGDSIDLGKDFLQYEPEEQYDIIITNPPFSIKNKILQRCIDLKKPFILLLSATCIQSASLIKIISKCENFNFIMFDKRISYSGDRPPFPSWYFTNNILDKNEFYIYQEDPKKMLIN